MAVEGMKRKEKYRPKWATRMTRSLEDEEQWGWCSRYGEMSITESYPGGLLPCIEVRTIKIGKLEAIELANQLLMWANSDHVSNLYKKHRNE